MPVVLQIGLAVNILQERALPVGRNSAISASANMIQRTSMS